MTFIQSGCSPVSTKKSKQPQRKGSNHTQSLENYHNYTSSNDSTFQQLFKLSCIAFRGIAPLCQIFKILLNMATFTRFTLLIFAITLVIALTYCVYNLD
jgi:hypothetical protein